MIESELMVRVIYIGKLEYRCLSQGLNNIQKSTKRTSGSKPFQTKQTTNPRLKLGRISMDSRGIKMVCVLEFRKVGK